MRTASFRTAQTFMEMAKNLESAGKTGDLTAIREAHIQLYDHYPVLIQQLKAFVDQPDNPSHHH